MDKLSAVNFKEGDLVVVVLSDVEIQVAKVKNNNRAYGYPLLVPLKGGSITVDEQGVFENEGTSITNLFHATPENIAAVNQLYGCYLELPMTPNEICKAMLGRCDEFVVCAVSDDSYEDAKRYNKVVVMWDYCSHRDVVIDHSGVEYKYCIPIDPRTGFEITEADLQP